MLQTMLKSRFSRLGGGTDIALANVKVLHAGSGKSPKSHGRAVLPPLSFYSLPAPCLPLLSTPS